jgi:hypothetical protein
MQGKLLWIISINLDATGQLLIIYSAFTQHLGKKWEYNAVVHQFFIDFKKTYDSVRREVLYNTMTEFSIPMKLVRLIKICLTETYNRVQADKNFSGMFY